MRRKGSIGREWRSHDNGYGPLNGSIELSRKCVEVGSNSSSNGGAI